LRLSGGEKISRMINLKQMFLIIAVLSAVAVAMTHTVTLFSGQHSWYDLSGSGSNVPCLKCHEDIGRELDSGGVHTSIDCECCHRTSKMVGYAAVNGSLVEPGQGAHSASTEECMLCHNGIRRPETNFTHDYLSSSACFQCHDSDYVLLAAAAGGFGLTPDLCDTGTKAAHRSFVLEAMIVDDSLMAGANEACIACHTTIKANIEFNVSTEAKITVNNVYNDSYSYWAVTEITPTNYIPYTEVKE